MIYLDNNATTPVDPEVSDAIYSSLKRDTGNPSSSHLFGQKAQESVATARKNVSHLLECSADDIYFTSGGTESNNLALLGVASLYRQGHIVTSVIEHPSVINVCKFLETRGHEVTYVPVDSDGIIKLQDLKKAIKKSTFLISVMHSNNETGVLQPVREIGDFVRERGITFHVDAAQSVGKIHVGLSSLHVDIMTVVSHKFYGPKGIGALYIKKGTVIKPVFFGAGHEKGLRPGTENVPGIAGFGKACSIAERDMELRIVHTTKLRDHLFDSLREQVADIKLNGHSTLRLPNTLNISISGISASRLIDKLNDRVAASAGSACHAGRQTPSLVLKSMGLSDADALSSIRLSVGKDNTDDEIDEATQIIIRCISDLRLRRS